MTVAVDDVILTALQAQRGEARCVRRQVVASIFNKDGVAVSGGVNGSPNEEALGDCLTGGCPRSVSQVPPGSSYDTGEGACIALHAEQVAIIAASWEDMDGGTLYVTDEPCFGCRKMILGTPLARVIWPFGSLVRGEAS